MGQAVSKVEDAKTFREVLIYFFFSSRRRHTRCSRDWSSDVCSSDLKTGVPMAAISPTSASSPKHAARRRLRRDRKSVRVGKECRSRSLTYSQSKQTRISTEPVQNVTQTPPSFEQLS